MADALFSFDYPGAAYLMMGLNGISAILASLGGIIFIVVIVGSVLFGKKIGTTETQPQAQQPAAAVFFTAFVLYYFVNWKYLAEVWPLR